MNFERRMNMAKVELTLKEYDELKMYKDIVEGLFKIRVDEWSLERHNNGANDFINFESDPYNEIPKRLTEMFLEKTKQSVREIAKEKNIENLDIDKLSIWGTLPRIGFSVDIKQEEV